MNQPIDELIDQDLEKAVSGISISAGFNNDFVVEHEQPDPNPPDPINPQGVYCIILPGDTVPADDVPMNRSDFIGTWFLMCYVFEPKESGRWDQRMRTVHWDVRRAVMQDYQRGTNPQTGQKLAIWTRIPVARPMDLSQAQHRGVIIQVDVRFRTNLDDGYNP